MLGELRQAIEAAEWPRALILALDTWRATRSPIVADLIDRIATRCPTESAPKRVHPWWMARARAYDPIVAGALAASASELANKSDVTWEVIAERYGTTPIVRRLLGAVETSKPGQVFRGIGHRNLVERFLAITQWPDDPRAARVIARWFVDAQIAWPWPHDAAVLVLYELFADELVRLRDSRVIPMLEACVAEPRGKIVPIRERQRELATATIDAITAAMLEAPLVDPEIARWGPVVVVPPDSPDDRLLWREAAINDDARLVLADYLLQRGDRRGEIITLACSGTDDNLRRSSALLHEHWEHWMGELALVLERGHCTFVGGLMDVATVGIYSTPEWAYPKVARHRELASVRTIRPGWNASDRGYVAFLDALETIPARIRLTATMIELLSFRRAVWPIRHLELVANLPDLRVPIAGVVNLAAALMPDVETIEFPTPGEIDADALGLIVRTLPDQLPKLTRIRIDAARHLPDETRRSLVALETLPLVDIDHGTFRC